jgi:hypothetical protein
MGTTVSPRAAGDAADSQRAAFTAAASATHAARAYRGSDLPPGEWQGEQLDPGHCITPGEWQFEQRAPRALGANAGLLGVERKMCADAKRGASDTTGDEHRGGCAKYLAQVAAQAAHQAEFDADRLECFYRGPDGGREDAALASAADTVDATSIGAAVSRIVTVHGSRLSRIVTVLGGLLLAGFRGVNFAGVGSIGAAVSRIVTVHGGLPIAGVRGMNFAGVGGRLACSRDCSCEQATSSAAAAAASATHAARVYRGSDLPPGERQGEQLDPGRCITPGEWQVEQRAPRALGANAELLGVERKMRTGAKRGAPDTTGDEHRGGCANYLAQVAAKAALQAEVDADRLERFYRGSIPTADQEEAGEGRLECPYRGTDGGRASYIARYAAQAAHQAEVDADRRGCGRDCSCEQATSAAAAAASAARAARAYRDADEQRAPRALGANAKSLGELRALNPAPYSTPDLKHGPHRGYASLGSLPAPGDAVGISNDGILSGELSDDDAAAEASAEAAAEASAELVAASAAEAGAELAAAAAAEAAAELADLHGHHRGLRLQDVGDALGADAEFRLWVAALKQLADDAAAAEAGAPAAAAGIPPSEWQGEQLEPGHCIPQTADQLRASRALGADVSFTGTTDTAGDTAASDTTGVANRDRCANYHGQVAAQAAHQAEVNADRLGDLPLVKKGDALDDPDQGAAPRDDAAIHLAEKGDSAATSAATASQRRADADAHSDLVVHLSEKGDTAGAVAAFRAALDFDPMHAQDNLGFLLNDLGVLLGQRGDAEGAEAALRAALDFDPAYAALVLVAVSANVTATAGTSTAGATTNIRSVIVTATSTAGATANICSVKRKMRTDTSTLLLSVKRKKLVTFRAAQVAQLLGLDPTADPAGRQGGHGQGSARRPAGSMRVDEPRGDN